MPERCPLDRGRVLRDLRGRTVDGRYRIIELLGVGGMGSAVWRAHQESIRRDVALKLLPEPEPEAAKRFERGARLASNLNHPHIVTVHDYGRTAGGELFLVMELLRGQELTELLRAHERLAPETVLRLADQALQALHHAHKRRVVHRDIKPGNLFVVESDDEPLSLKILDFGIARFFEDEAAPEGGLAERVDGDVTTVHKICGTPRYMSPEQIAREPVDGRTDLYSLGVVLYQCLTGRPPFDGDLTRLLYSHLHLEPPPPRSVRADVHPLLEAVVLKAMAKLPDDRFESAREMRHTLYDVQQEMGLAVSGPPTGALPALTGSYRAPSGEHSGEIPSPAPRRRVGALLGLAGLAGLVGLGVWWLGRVPEPTVHALDADQERSVWIRTAADAAPTTAVVHEDADAERPASAAAAPPDAGDAPATAEPDPSVADITPAPQPAPTVTPRVARPRPAPARPPAPAPDATVDAESPPAVDAAPAEPDAAPAVAAAIGGPAPARVEPLVLGAPTSTVEPLRLDSTGAQVTALELPGSESADAGPSNR